MALLTPDIGLLFWMLLSFGIVFFVLAKFGFPVILKMIEERKDYIEKSLQAAKEANRQLANIKVEGEKLLQEARVEQSKMLKDAGEMREMLIKEAKQQASVEAEKVLLSAREAIQKEKETAIRDIRSRVTELSLDIAEKVLRKNLENKPTQVELVEKLLDEATIKLN